MDEAARSGPAHGRKDGIAWSEFDEPGGHDGSPPSPPRSPSPRRPAWPSPPPAHAETFPITDTFDDSRLWTVEEVPGASSAFVGTLGEGHTGANAAYLDAFPFGPAEARVFRAITLNNGASLPITCQATVWVRAVPMPEQGSFPPTGYVQVHLKVHSGGPTGQVISVRGASYTHSGWIQRNFAPIPWPGNTRTVTVEIAAYHGVAMADDLAVSC